MNKLSSMILAALLLSVPLLSGCPNDDGTAMGNQAAAVDDPHAGHDHGDEPVPVVEEEVDPHAGHDHGDEPEPVVEEEVDPHAGHDHGDEPEPVVEEEVAAEGSISLTKEQIKELGIISAPAGPGALGRDLELTGEVAINEDAMTHVSPRIGGIIRKVYHKLGDEVKVGTALLELDSIELAEVKSSYLAVLSRIDLAQQTMEREEKLFAKGISAEQDYLEAKQAYDEELITKRTIKQMLSAMGLSTGQIDGLTKDSTASLTRYTVYSPVGGEIIEKHASIGEMVESGTEVFTIGNMCSVWVRLNVYLEDFSDVHEGMSVLIDPGNGADLASGIIDYIEPMIGEETRTAVARVVMPCMGHVLRPGLFVKGIIEVAGEPVELVVPRNSVVDLDQDKLVFVRKGTSFEPRMVSIGVQTIASIEILTGLKPGEEIVTAGAFQLKAELLKGTFDPHAGHAH